jgi:hypothetical protein
MKTGKMVVGAALLCGISSFTGLAAAQEATTKGAAEEGHAQGFMVQARLQGQGGLLSLGGGSGFLLGYRGSSYGLGLGLGFNRVGLSAGSGGSGSLTLFQVMPTALIDVWRSRDGRARANLIGGIGYGRGSLSGTGTTRSCVTDALGNETCTTRSEEIGASASFVPFMVGFGGDYFLSRNFALGAELGVQAAFTAGIATNDNGVSRGVDASGNMQLAYGALRATFVLGD